MESEINSAEGSVFVGDDIDWQSLDKSKFYVWSFAFFMGVRTLVYPPILIKTRLQVQQGRSQYRGTFDAFRKIFKLEGFRGFYKGFLTTSVGIIPGQFMYITVYEFVRHRIKSFFPTDSLRYDALRNFIGGGTASLASSLVSVPLDVISQLLMIQDGTVNKRKYSGGINAFCEILKTEGVRGLYRGYTASMMVYVPSSGIWWGTYASVKGKAAAFINEQGGLLRQLDVLVFGLCGILAGSTAVVVTNPMDVVKTRLQVLAYTNPLPQRLRPKQRRRRRSSRPRPAASGHQSPLQLEVIRRSPSGRPPSNCSEKKGITARMMSMAPVSFLMTITYEQAKRLSVKQ
ncbi:Mitochondrial carrier protein [Acanthamoeba castellanii str. Neff]|uniref:Mitochondrial carrier protein n=1 Tax=Acanthamoeba castellanii (strain ATCC 30010 / Neff) TaxID=1257118 RepID=L8H8X8_ACACF|nr:Mitochondrial carrier protein [Acanthamoeba castellanii str. Neff]ELR21605.1 Mitochondrial carrier protein [Acanthamoeba castellanii str. Neff]